MSDSTPANANVHVWFGIDVSSETLDIADFPLSFSETFDNDVVGIARLVQLLQKHDVARIVVEATGGYDPTSTPSDSGLIKAQTSVLRRHGIEPLLWPRSAGSWPGFVFTGPPLRLPAGHFGLGHGSGAHAPDEYYVIESTNPKVEGLNGATLSFVEYLFELAAV